MLRALTWVFGVIVSLPLAETSAQTYRIRQGVSQGYQNMRSGPGQGHGIVAQIPAGTGGIQATGDCRDPDNSRSKFRWCEYHWQGLVGWMSSNGLEQDTRSDREASNAAMPDLTMVIGETAHSFHQELAGQSFVAWEMFEDAQLRYLEMFEAIFEAAALQAPPRPGVREVDQMGNAVAVVFQKRRYLLVDPNMGSSEPKQILLFGHELGHHACGHTAGVRPPNAWDRELEADRFAGAAARALYIWGSAKKGEYWPGYKGLSLATVLEEAGSLFSSEGSPSHPPGKLRVAAIEEGYKNSSPCIPKHALNKLPEWDTLGTGENAPMKINWRVKNNRFTPVGDKNRVDDIVLRFFSITRGVVWPSKETVFALPDHYFRTFTQSCMPGERICYGAWDRATSHARFWGVGPNGRMKCRDCCNVCGQEAVIVEFSRD